MSSDWDRKTEKPTEARRRLAREQGRVAVSRDLVAAFSLLWVLLAFHQFAGPFLERAVVSVRQMLQAAFSPQSLTAVETASILRDSLLEALGLLVPVLMAVLVLVLISSLVQSGWILRPAAVSPDPGRPVAGGGIWQALLRELTCFGLLRPAEMRLACSRDLLGCLSLAGCRRKRQRAEPHGRSGVDGIEPGRATSSQRRRHPLHGPHRSWSFRLVLPEVAVREGVDDDEGRAAGRARSPGNSRERTSQAARLRQAAALSLRSNPGRC